MDWYTAGQRLGESKTADDVGKLTVVEEVRLLSAVTGATDDICDVVPDETSDVKTSLDKLLSLAAHEEKSVQNYQNSPVLNYTKDTRV